MIVETKSRQNQGVKNSKMMKTKIINKAIKLISRRVKKAKSNQDREVNLPKSKHM